MDSCQWVNAFYPQNRRPFLNGNSDTFYFNRIFLRSALNCLAHIITDIAELQPGNLVNLERYGPDLTSPVPSESRLTFLDSSFPFKDLGLCWLLPFVIKTPQCLLLSSICYHVLLYVNIP